jgi:8-oxo-dGTP pyrophosphatase MutT (NUDIX family)
VPTVRPRDAAGTILIRAPRDGRGQPEVLLGRRHGRARFMPGLYVGPGGRIEPIDATPSGFAESLPDTSGAVDRDTRRRLALFARCALRETAEETGLLLGQAGAAPPRVAPVWRPFQRAGIAPGFADLRLIARAITPADSPIRFHTRFFLANGDAVAGSLKGDGELEDLRWVAAARLESLPMPEVTALVVADALRQRSRPEAVRAYTWRGGRRFVQMR